jgi:hypothetical protein
MPKNLVSEILSFGDEITCGKLLDRMAMAEPKAERSGDFGSLPFVDWRSGRRHQVALRRQSAGGRDRLLGGGPTEDDLPSAAAQIVNVELEFDESSGTDSLDFAMKSSRRGEQPNKAMRPRGSQ